MSESNIFAEQERKRAENVELWGLADVPEAWRSLVELHASRIISKQNITDDEEKQKVYDDVKKQCLEHYVVNKVSDETTKASSSKTTSEPEDTATEFEKGYEAFWKDQERVEKFRASPYRQGYEAAEQEWLDRKVPKLSTIEYAENDSANPVREDSIREELQQLKEGFQVLDERLKALEKYTKE
jgi:hypothetical protein